MHIRRRILVPALTREVPALTNDAATTQQPVVYDLAAFETAFNLVMNTGQTPVMPVAVYHRLTDPSAQLTPMERHLLSLMDLPPGQVHNPSGLIYGMLMYFRDPGEGDIRLI